MQVFQYTVIFGGPVFVTVSEQCPFSFFKKLTYDTSFWIVYLQILRECSVAVTLSVLFLMLSVRLSDYYCGASPTADTCSPRCSALGHGVLIGKLWVFSQYMTLRHGAPIRKFDTIYGLITRIVAASIMSWRANQKFRYHIRTDHALSGCQHVMLSANRETSFELSLYME
jgi:hypothetical protein